MGNFCRILQPAQRKKTFYNAFKIGKRQGSESSRGGIRERKSVGRLRREKPSYNAPRGVAGRVRGWRFGDLSSVLAALEIAVWRRER